MADSKPTTELDHEYNVPQLQNTETLSTESSNTDAPSKDIVGVYPVRIEHSEHGTLEALVSKTMLDKINSGVSDKEALDVLGGYLPKAKKAKTEPGEDTDESWPPDRERKLVKAFVTIWKESGKKSWPLVAREFEKLSNNVDGIEPDEGRVKIAQLQKEYAKRPKTTSAGDLVVDMLYESAFGSNVFTTSILKGPSVAGTIGGAKKRSINSTNSRSLLNPEAIVNMNNTSPIASTSASDLDSSFNDLKPGNPREKKWSPVQEHLWLRAYINVYKGKPGHSWKSVVEEYRKLSHDYRIVDTEAARLKIRALNMRYAKKVIKNSQSETQKPIDPIYVEAFGEMPTIKKSPFPKRYPPPQEDIPPPVIIKKDTRQAANQSQKDMKMLIDYLKETRDADVRMRKEQFRVQRDIAQQAITAIHELKTAISEFKKQ